MSFRSSLCSWFLADLPPGSLGDGGADDDPCCSRHSIGVGHCDRRTAVVRVTYKDRAILGVGHWRQSEKKQPGQNDSRSFHKNSLALLSAKPERNRWIVFGIERQT